MILNAQFPTQEQTRPGFLISTNATLLDVNMIHQYLAKESYWAQGVSLEIVQRSLQYSLYFGVYKIADWENWTGLHMPQSGLYLAKGGLNPIKINTEKNIGIYLEPNVWMVAEL